jgi:hypothetical protein
LMHENPTGARLIQADGLLPEDTKVRSSKYLNNPIGDHLAPIAPPAELAIRAMTGWPGLVHNAHLSRLAILTQNLQQGSHVMVDGSDRPRRFPTRLAYCN